MAHDPWPMVHYPQNHSKTTMWDSRTVPDRCGGPVRAGRASFIMRLFFSTHFVPKTLNRESRDTMCLCCRDTMCLRCSDTMCLCCRDAMCLRCGDAMHLYCSDAM